MSRNLRAINRFGSKVGSAHRYPEPKFSTLNEPFAGGAGYALRHDQKLVHLADLDDDIVNVWRYLIYTHGSEIRQLPLIAPEQDVADLDCSAGGRLLISWCLNQTSTPRRKLSSWGVYHNNKGSACYWGSARREQAALIADRVKHWSIAQCDYREIPNQPATWFIDPPYQQGGKNYRHSQIDYAELADWCRTRRGQVIVCERTGADWLPFRELYTAPTARRFGSGRGRCREAIWTNDQ